MQESINNQSMLKVGTILHGTYRIDSYLSSGGFGNTYVATNIEFEERVAIKEFFMKGVTQRDDNQTTVSVSNTENHNSFLEQREKFKKEARRIRQLNNPHIVRVHDLFEENGTAYYVMDYVDGENLSDRLKRTGKPMTEDEVNQILPQILDALKSIHDAGIWHLDLKPANIMVDKNGQVKLIDFGASKQLNAQKGGATASTAISYTNGYAPREQMEQNYDKFGPWTDIYALGATLYNLLTNKRPPLPTDIDDDISEDKHVALPFPESVDGLRFLVLQMMKTNRLQRPQNIDAIIAAEASKTVKPKQAPKQQPTSQSTTTYDDEATIIAQPQPKKEEKVSNIQSEHSTKTEAWVETNEASNKAKSIVIWMAVIFLFILILIWGLASNKQYEGENTYAEIVDSDYVAALGENTKVKNGFYTETFDDGSKYEGNYKDGLFNGQGTYTWANGDKYEGEFKEGVRIKGTYTWPEKRKGYMYKYVGEFKNNEFDGKGTAYYVGGETESGIWKNGKFVGTETEQNLTPLEQKVVGKHLMELFWIGGDEKFGYVNITKEADGRLKCKGSQYSDDRADYVIMNGFVEIENANHLVFKGKISIRVHDINNGQEYVRDGAYDFKAYNGRKYWRLQQMETPSGETDNLDIFFAKTK